jgi:hypothetical protein
LKRSAIWRMVRAMSDTPMVHARPPKKKPRRTAIDGVMSRGGIAVAVGVVVGAFAVARFAAITHAHAWMTPGEPCPTMTQAQLQASGQALGHGFTYHGVGFARAYGYVNCDEVTPDLLGLKTVPVCQFNSPTVLQVTTGGRNFLYATPVRPMTVWVSDKGPTCVMSLTARLKVSALGRALRAG